MTDTAHRLASVIAADDRLLAECVSSEPAFAAGPAADAAAGPRAAADPESYRYALEAIREGHLLHGGSGQLIGTSDGDLALLAGDRLYAEGLVKMAELGDSFAISELSSLIVSCAVARAAGDGSAMESAWAEACARIGGVE